MYLALIVPCMSIAFIFMYAAICRYNVNIAFFPLIGTRYKMSRFNRETPLVIQLKESPDLLPNK